MSTYTPRNATYTPSARGCKTVREAAGRPFYVGHESVTANVYGDANVAVHVGLRIAYEGPVPAGFANDTEFVEWIRQTAEEFAEEFPYGTTGVRKGAQVEEIDSRFIRVTIVSNASAPVKNVGQKAAAMARKAAGGRKIHRISSGGTNRKASIAFRYTYVIAESGPETAPEIAPAPEVPAAPVAPEEAPRDGYGYLWTADVASPVEGRMSREWHALEDLDHALCGATALPAAEAEEMIPGNAQVCGTCLQAATKILEGEPTTPTRVRLFGTTGWGARFGTLVTILTPTVFRFDYQGKRYTAERGADGFYVRYPSQEMGPGAIRVDIADPDGTFEGKTAAEWRGESSRHRSAELRSFERSEEDGFLSQRASAQAARDAEIRAELAEFGAFVEREALFDRDGNLVRADYRGTRFGAAWMVRLEGRRVGWFRPSEASKPEGRWKADERKGYHVGRVLVPARVEFRAGGSGLAGAYSGDYVAVRASEELDYANVIVLDDTTRSPYRPDAR